MAAEPNSGGPTMVPTPAPPPTVARRDAAARAPVEDDDLDEPPADDAPNARGTGCSVASGGTPSWGAGILLGLAALARRRRKGGGLTRSRARYESGGPAR
jgi:MYXO-CTERM domain-containing protein